MVSGATVVVVYDNDLLGEGLARYLRERLGLEVSAVATADPPEVERTLACAPCAVVVESTDTSWPARLAALVPKARIFGITPVIASRGGPSAGMDRVDALVEAVRSATRMSA